jgi:glycosyltransferase involved in cell wall biosynthesis
VRGYHDGARVIVTGEVADVRPYIARAAVGLNPILSGTGMRTKVLDYAAAGRPCVSTSLGASGHGLRDGHEIAIVDDPSAFAARLAGLLRDPAAARAMGAAAWARGREATLRDAPVAPLLRLVDGLCGKDN